jgi:hypothetical protein
MTWAVISEVWTKTRLLFRLGDKGYRYLIHPLETEAGLTQANLSFGFDPGDLRRYGMKFDGATADDAAFVNALKVGAKGIALTAPAGVSVLNNTSVLPNNLTLRGAGINNTTFQYTGASDAFQINNPINSSTAAYIRLENFQIKSTTVTAGKASLADVGSTFLYIDRVQFRGNTYGLILDQSELVHILDCDFELPNSATAAGIWMVNGAEHTAGASELYTNQITIESCEFNGYAVGVGVADDGGNAHCYLSNNFNALDKHIRCAQVHNMAVIAGEMEVCTTASITFESTKFGGNASPGAAYGITLRSVRWAVAGANCINVAAAGLVHDLDVSFCNIDCTGTAFANANNIGLLHAEGNFQNSTGDGYTIINNYFDDLAYTCALTSSGTAPAIGNGTINAITSRKGTQVTVRVRVTIGSTTTVGTGNWQLSLPVAAVENSQEFWGSGMYDHAGAITPALARIVQGGTVALAYQCSSNAAIGATNPAWSAGDIWELDVTYTAANKIN